MFLFQDVTVAAVTAADVAGTAVRLTSPPGAGSAYSKRTFQGIVKTTSGSAAITASIIIQVSNDPLVVNANATTAATASWLTLGTINLTGTASTTAGVSAGLAVDENWIYTRGYLMQNSLTGANAVLSLILGA